MTVVRIKTFLILLTLTVIVFGAYVRLTDAGLGCPDWPGCYGKLVPSGSSGYEGSGEYDSGKAWREMIHRYLAGFLGIGIFGLALHSLRVGNGFRSLELTLLPLIVFQSILGMFTVTLLLKPLVVSLHLMGGLTILSVLWWSLLRDLGLKRSVIKKSGLLKKLGWLAFSALVVQIFLGGWTSTNYAALACTDFPTCQGSLMPPIHFREAFTLWRGLGIDYEYGVLDSATRTTIHYVHRFWALVTVALVANFLVVSILFGDRRLKLSSTLVFAAISAQVGLGISNVIYGLPLGVAVAHNGVAAILTLAMLTHLYLIIIEPMRK
tara:strand:+ start:164 stop:1129 length:966 start_codon:yes stop_codon:yes gene_type:complete